MAKKVVYEAKTERLEILNPSGKVDQKLMPDLTEFQVVDLYKTMTLMRAVDQKAVKLQRQGRMGTWASLQGQEAAQAGIVLAMRREDWLAPTFRESGAMLAFGVPAESIYAYWIGDERASVMPEGVNSLPPSVPIASQFLHGVGIGMAMKKQGKNAAAVAFGGDGSTSEGDFHEAMNFAGVFKANTVFIVQNNQWAISVPRKGQTAAGSIAQKSHAYGIEGIQVDGNDVFAAYVAAKEALEKARSGKGATLIELETYRMGNHTTADEASRYRSKEEVEKWKVKDPILRLKKYMEGQKIWDAKKQEALDKEIEEIVSQLVATTEKRKKASPLEMFQSMYKEMPQNLKEQMQELKEEVGE